MRCYFHLLSDQEELIDDVGIEVLDLESAKIEAWMAVCELQRECGGAIEEWSGWRLQVLCPEGTLLYSFALPTTLH